MRDIKHRSQGWLLILKNSKNERYIYTRILQKCHYFLVRDIDRWAIIDYDILLFLKVFSTVIWSKTKAITISRYETKIKMVTK